MVALALAVLFLAVASGLEISSIRSLEALRYREQAALLLQQQVNALRAPAEYGGQLVNSTTEQTVDGRTYSLSVQVTPANVSSEIQLFPVQPPVGVVAQYASRVRVAVRWQTVSGESLELTRSEILTAFVAKP